MSGSGYESSESVELNQVDIDNIYDPGSQDQKPNINGLVQDGQPYLEIIEQPQTRGFRFRYGCEGASHGGLQGVSSSKKGGKTFPTVQIMNYKGPARVTVSLVTDEDSPKPHCHQLIGKNCADGVCVMEIRESSDMKAVLANLGVLHITRRKVQEVLTARVIEAIRLEKMVSNQMDQREAAELTAEETKRAQEEADDQAKSMALNAVRLCFQAYLMEDGRFSKLLPSVISNPIYDSKSPGAASLKICRMDKHAGRCTGDDEVFLLCDKVQKDDITVRFFEEDENGRVKWEDFGNFGPADVHRQYAIVFKTPAYCNRNIDQPVQVKVQLQRLSDEQRSDSKPFTYYPQQIDEEEVRKKRKKAIFPQIGSGSFASDGLFGGGGGGAGGGQGNSFGNSLGGNMASFAQKTEDGLFRPRQATAQLSAQMMIPHMDFAFEGMTQTPPYMLPDVGSIIPIGRGFKQEPGLCTRMSPAPRPADNADIEVDAAPDEPISLPRPVKVPEKDPVRQHSVEIGGSWVSGPEKAADVELSILDSGCCLSRSVVSNSISQEEDPAQTALRPSQVPISLTPPKPNTLKPEAEDITVTVSQPPTKPQEEPAPVEERPPSTENASVPGVPTLDDVWRFAENAARALQEYAKTGEVSHILVVLRKLVQQQDENGDNALHLAVIHRQPVVLQNLLRAMSTLPHPAAINQLNHLMQSPLHLAVITNQSGVAQLLLDHNCDPSKRDLRGNTPTHLAALYGHDLCLESMLPWDKHQLTSQIFPQLNLRNFDGFSALHLAAQAGSLKCVKTLAQAGVDINLQDGKSGSTALHHAVEVQSLPIVGYLILEAGAAINSPRYDGNTALHLAAAGDMLAVAALLVAAGADVEAENADSDSDLEPDDERDEDTADAENVKGQTPYEVARSDKMRRILAGEPYISVSELSTMEDDSEMSSYALPSQSGRGDMDRVDSVVYSRLAQLLDPTHYGRDWMELALRLGMVDLVDHLGVDRSPTKALLANYKAVDGTVQQLRQSLGQMDRYDAVAVLTDAGLMPQETMRSRLSSQQFSDVIESGVQRLTITH